MRKSTLCIIVPAYNEAAVIDSSLQALCRVIDKEHIYLVSDGSSDNTAWIARNYLPHVLELTENVGKARALQSLINYFELTKRYHYILFADADSRMSPNFLYEIAKVTEGNPAVIVGTVASDPKGLISAFRTYEYAMAHRIFKQAQSDMGVISVAPGCASLYRSDILDQLNFSNHTLTEDFDLTIQIHHKKLGKIVYAPGAKVITQDPPTFKDYWKQIVRWYTGTWQNIFLHRLYIPKNKLALEMALLMIDNIAASAVLVWGLFHPLVFGTALLATYTWMVILAALFISLERQWWALLYVPLFPFVYLFNLVASPYAFLRTILSRGRQLGWNKVARYSVK